MERSAIAGLIWLTGFIFRITASLCELHGWRVSPYKDACVVALGAAADLMSDGLQLQLWVLEGQRHITVAVSRLSGRVGLAMTPISWFKLTQK